MAARKPNSSLRDRGLSPSSSPVHRSLLRRLLQSAESKDLSGGTEVTTMAKEIGLRPSPQSRPTPAARPPLPPDLQTSPIACAN
ncbi:hypothetical protein HPP92_010456 [Vanilla planifolia]|uniref:Uncharacterized protein n=1 Tax=Vanilla planifolia TaxID=51239 RepID=A0A835R454_VANPL|nr:hypothetical protein HPP92_010456 [Vanilla planifolia]